MRHSVEKQSKQSSQHARKTLELRMEMKWENGHGNGKNSNAPQHSGACE